MNVVTNSIPSREAILAVIDDAQREGDRLFDKTNEAGRAGRDLTQLGTLIAMFGEHARRGLRALRLLSDHAFDDQAAYVARGLVDAAITVDYIRRPTIRCAREVQIALSVEQKLGLFWSFKAIAEQHSKEQRDKSTPKSVEYDNAVRIRVDLGILKRGKRPSQYWSGANPWHMYRESAVANAAEGRQEGMASFRGIFEDLSFYAHANPNDGAYFIVEQRGDGGASLLLRGDHENTAVYGAAATAALLTLARWGEQLGEDPRLAIVPLVLRLRPVGGKPSSNE